MTHFIKAGLLIATLAISACTNADRFDDGSGAGAGVDGGLDTLNLDPAANPDSPEYFSQTIGDRVLFQVDTSNLTAAGMATLDGQSAWLMSHSEFLAVIEGHADEQGTREYNLALGARRANAVREYLVSKGVPAARLRTVSYGKERPIGICSEESCYAQNRRAVTIISSGALS